MKRAREDVGARWIVFAYRKRHARSNEIHRCSFHFTQSDRFYSFCYRMLHAILDTPVRLTLGIIGPRSANASIHVQYSIKYASRKACHRHRPFSPLPIPLRCCNSLAFANKLPHHRARVGSPSVEHGVPSATRVN